MSNWNDLVSAIRKDYPFFACPDNQGWAYFDSAATALKPKAVLDAGYNYNACYTANIHRAVFDNSYKASNAYEKARSTVAQFLGAQHASEVVFTSGATAGINLFARSYAESFLKKGDRIICTQMEHHANLVSWQKIAQEFECEIVYVPLQANGTLNLDVLPSLLTPNAKLMVLTAVSNVLGTVNPVEDIAVLCASKNVHIFVDVAQSVVHMPYDLKNSAIDFLVFSGHKMFAPTGIGVFYGKKSLLKNLPPFFYGGGMVQDVSLEKTTYAPSPSRFEGGTPPISQAIALGAAINYMQGLGWQTIHVLETYNLEYGLKIFQKYHDKGISLVGNAPNRVPIFSFTVRDVHPHDVGTFLSEQKIAVRTGHQCTQPLLHQQGLSSVTRVSCALYNTQQEWDQLDNALSRLLEFFHV
ncbi:MAG: aminotransferase class V-fold PLP-dependent enzyme [Brevinema sp.]